MGEETNVRKDTLLASKSRPGRGCEIISQAWKFRAGKWGWCCVVAHPFLPIGARQSGRTCSALGNEAPLRGSCRNVLGMSSLGVVTRYDTAIGYVGVVV